VYAAAGQWQPLIDNVGHTNPHYGNIITYMRMWLVRLEPLFYPQIRCGTVFLLQQSLLETRRITGSRE
jgi:hypothetical protein